MSVSPLRSPLRRRYSSAETTTTSSRPCTVTCCGPSLRTRRTSSLKRALASCSRQLPEGRGGVGGVLKILVILTSTSHTPSYRQVDSIYDDVLYGLDRVRVPQRVASGRNI